MFECFHCGERQLVWENDFDASDLGYDQPGIVQFLHCENCGAEVEYKIFDKEEE